MSRGLSPALRSRHTDHVLLAQESYRQVATQHATRTTPEIQAKASSLAAICAGGEGTDAIAHLTGFFSGLMLGAVYGSLANRLRLNAPMQLAFGSLAISLLAFAWLSALRAQLH